MATRIYSVTQRCIDTAKPAPLIRLVRAHSQAQAIRHVAKGYQAAVASQDDLVSAVGSGVQVEVAGDDTRDKGDPSADPSSEGGTPD